VQKAERVAVRELRGFGPIDYVVRRGGNARGNGRIGPPGAERLEANVKLLVD